MSDQHIDIERMIMQARYAMQLEAEASSVKGGQLSDMERERYQNQIKVLLQAVETLLKSNNALGERVAQLEKIVEDYEDLKAENAKLKGELAMRKRGQHGKKSEKTRINTSVTEAGMMYLQLTMTRMRKKRMLLRQSLRRRSPAI